MTFSENTGVGMITQVRSQIALCGLASQCALLCFLAIAFHLFPQYGILLMGVGMIMQGIVMAS